MHRILQWLSRLICAVRGHAWRGGDGCRPWCARCAMIGPMTSLSPDQGMELLAVHRGMEVQAGFIARLERDCAELKREANASERVCEQLEQQLVAERASFKMMREARATHRCKVCDALWVQHPAGGGWSLCSDACGKCCDNEAMGDQIEAIGVTAERDDLRRQLAEARGENARLITESLIEIHRTKEAQRDVAAAMAKAETYFQCHGDVPCGACITCLNDKIDQGKEDADKRFSDAVAMNVRLLAEQDAAWAENKRVGLSPGVLAIAAERQRQIEVEGWTPDHDDRHALHELASAASAYAFIASLTDRSDLEPPGWWPWSRTWWKPKNRRRDLERAGALIAAAIDREDRCAARAGGVS